MMLLRIDQQGDMGSRLKLLTEPHTETLKTWWQQQQCHQQNVKYFMPMVGGDGDFGGGGGDGYGGVDDDGDCDGGGCDGYGGGGGDVRDGVGVVVLAQHCNHS